jgi:hypothetical protein
MRASSPDVLHDRTRPAALSSRQDIRSRRRVRGTIAGRKFTPDGHIVGTLGEVIAAEALALTLHPASHPSHDASDAAGDVQIKVTGGDSVAPYSTCQRRRAESRVAARG